MRKVVFFNNLIKRRNQEADARRVNKIWAELASKVKNNFITTFSSLLPPDATVLDFGCGEGKDIVQFIGENKSRHGVGIDMSLESLQKTTQNASNANLEGRIDFTQCDVNHLPFRDDSFDGVFIHHVLHHFSSLSSIDSVHTVIKEDGKLLIIDQPMTNPFKFIGRKIARYIDLSSFGYGKSFYFFSPRGLKHRVCQSGFEIVEEDYREILFYLTSYLALFLPPYDFYRGV